MNESGANDCGVGLVETRVASIPLPRGGFELECGGALPELRVAYECYGRLSEAGDNAVLVCHALSGDAHAAGRYAPEDKAPGWWDAMIGPGRGIDTNRFFVVCSNILGGCMGTTGPSSIHPHTGKPYGSLFPSITVGDMVRAQRLLLGHLGIERIAAVIGGSLGGMQVVEWCARYPRMVDRAVCIASALHLSTQALAFDIVGRNAITSDPAWAGGDYYGTGRIPAAGLAQARMIGHITYLSPDLMRDKFGREKKAVETPIDRFSTPFQIESYLDHQGDKFIKRFDANSYLHITEAMDSFDLSDRGGAEKVFFSPDLRARFLVVALSSDWLFPPEQSREITTNLIKAGKRVSYFMLRSPYGHDAFLVEIEHLSEVVSAFLESPLDAYSGGPAHSLTAGRDSPGAGADFASVKEMIRPGSRIIDLGCGDGALLGMLAGEKGVRGFGVDIDLQKCLLAARQGLDVLQCDMDEGMSLMPSGFYDYAVLSRTLQVVRSPRLVLNEMLRIAGDGIVVIPNLGHIRHRLRLGFAGRAPVPDPGEGVWYETPDIHVSTIRDFLDLCRREGIKIKDMLCVPSGPAGWMLVRLGLANLGADRIVARLSK